MIRFCDPIERALADLPNLGDLPDETLQGQDDLSPPLGRREFWAAFWAVYRQCVVSADSENDIERKSRFEARGKYSDFLKQQRERMQPIATPLVRGLASLRELSDLLLFNRKEQIGWQKAK